MCKPPELQIMPTLDAATEAALRASIEANGVVVPVVRDQHDRIIDGHHRVAIATELGIDYPTERITVVDETHALELARFRSTSTGATSRPSSAGSWPPTCAPRATACAPSAGRWGSLRSRPGSTRQVSRT